MLNKKVNGARNQQLPVVLKCDRPKHFWLRQYSYGVCRYLVPGILNIFAGSLISVDRLQRTRSTGILCGILGVHVKYKLVPHTGN